MPHIALAIAGAGLAGLYAAYRMAVRQIAKTKQASASIAPRDMGALEWDEQAGVYRPRNSR